ncbi:MAG: DMT family transporter [Parvibaculaceae bacterium]
MSSQSNLRGIACMVLSTGVFVTVDTSMKIVMADAGPLQVLFMRGVSASLWCLLTLLLLGHAIHLGQSLDRWVLLRAFFETLGVLAFMLALARMPIADITAIFQTTPLLLLMGVALVWRERIGGWRLALIFAGLAGALLVAQPGSSAASPYAVLGFLTALACAVRDMVARNIPRQIPALVATFTTLVMVMVVAGVLALLFETWVPPTGLHLTLVTAVGPLLMLAHMLVFLAYRFASAATVAPFYYTFMLWAVISGVLVFGDVPNGLAIAGMSFILLSGLTIVLMDGRQRRDAAATT